jgi:membrane-bound serine protease (ClpP class)
VSVLEWDGPIGPATADFFSQGLERSVASADELLVLQINTPGGLDTSMRSIIQDIIASPVPVATFVAPPGSRAASAGTYILYASHIAAMAPATNLGAATPVSIGGMPTIPEPDDSRPPDGSEEDVTDDETANAPRPAAGSSTMEKKTTNDARAYLRSLAQYRGRNAQWAELAVSDAATLTSSEALERGVIDVVAEDIAGLLAKLDGRSVRTIGGERTLQTAGGVVERIEPGIKHRILAAITNPQVAYILMLLGVYGLFFEFANPGALVPGVLGAICLLVALFAFQVLPINFAGLALLIVGLLFMVAEAFVPSFGVLGIGGLVAFLVGSVMLWEEDGPGYEIPIGLIGGFGVASVLIIVAFGRMMLRQRHRAAVSGDDALRGQHGTVVDDMEGDGWVFVHGETWHARSATPLRKGAVVEVVAREGLVLSVKPLEEGP